MLKRVAKVVLKVKLQRLCAQFSLRTMLLVLIAPYVWSADDVGLVRSLETQLRDPNENVREFAAQRLGYLGRDASSATSSLLQATEDDSSPVAVKAAWALSRVEGRANFLAPLLGHSHDQVRLAAAEGLLWNGYDPAKLVPMLLELWESDVYDVDSVFEALGPDQAAVVLPLLLDSLSTARDGEWVDQVHPAASALSHVAMPAPTVVPALIARLRHERPMVRTAAAEQLLRLGAAAKEAAVALRAGLHDPEPACATACAAALGAVDPDDAEFLLALRESLRSGDSMVQSRAASYLWMLGPSAAGLSDDLVAYLCDEQRRAHFPYYDLNALKRIGPPAVSSLDRALKQALADHARRLPVSPAFEAQFRSCAWSVKLRLERAMFDLQNAPYATGDVSDVSEDRPELIARPARVQIIKWALKLVSALPMPESRYMLPCWLAMLGPRAAPAVPTLVAALRDPYFSYFVLTGLQSLSQDAAPAVPFLVRLLDSDDDSTRGGAMFALGMIGKDAAPAVPRLLPLLDAEEALRGSAIFGLAMIGKDAAPAVPHLLRLLDSSDEVRRRGALFGLAAIGVYDDEARMRLRPFLSGNDVHQRALAALAVARPGGPLDEAVPVLVQLAAKTDWRAMEGENQGAQPAGAPAASPPQVGATLGGLMWAVSGREQADGLLPILIAMDQTVYGNTNRWNLRQQLITALASLGPAAVPGLIAELQNGDLRARRAAAEVLGTIGPAASDATPQLIGLLDDDEVWDAAAVALGRIGNATEALPKLFELLEALQAPSDSGEDDLDDDETGEDNPYQEQYVSILTALGSRGAEARTAAPVVVALANADDSEVRHAAIESLTRIDPDNPLLDRHLRRWLAEWERSSATDDAYSFDSSFDGLADSLRELGPRAEPFANDLHRLMASAPLAHPRVRCYAAFALAALPAHRQAAEDYLRSLTKAELSDSFECLSLADALLRRIAGDEQKSWMRLSMPFGVGP